MEWQKNSMPNSSAAKWITDEFSKSIGKLGCVVSDNKLRELAEIITVSMTNDRRSFHRPTHLLDLIDPNDAILNLAALFHDVVYYQVDQELPKPTQKMLAPFLLIDHEAITLRTDCGQTFSNFSLVCDLFQIAPGERLNPVKNLNEFLSGVVAFVSLSSVLPESILAQVIICIEATIPFRPQLIDNDPIENLEKRLVFCNEKYGLGLTQAQIYSAIERAVNLANRDVKNFASADPAWFLATTWQLMPERNESLRGLQYTFKDYRSSLQKMSDFFEFLTEGLVFKRFKNYPDLSLHQENTLLARRNLQIARTYIMAKLVAINLVETLAVLSGGDLPISDFLGPLPELETSKVRMEKFLPSTLAVADMNELVLRLLEKGLPITSTFDLKNSPLAAYIYRALGDKALLAISKKTNRANPQDALGSEYLTYFPSQVVADIAFACAKVCTARSADLLKLCSQKHTA
jgi:hypothetical protein